MPNEKRSKQAEKQRVGRDGRVGTASGSFRGGGFHQFASSFHRGILAAEVALEVDSDSMDFIVAIPTVMSAIFMDTDTKTVPIRTVS